MAWYWWALCAFVFLRWLDGNFAAANRDARQVLAELKNLESRLDSLEDLITHGPPGPPDYFADQAERQRPR